MSSMYEPLYIDTNIEYELDMKRFPGWDDPIRRAQPKLLIHQPENCMCQGKHQDLFNLIDCNPDILLECTEDDGFIDLSCTESDDIVDHLLNEKTDQLTDVDGAHVDPIVIPVLPISDDSGTDSVFEYLSASYSTSDDDSSSECSRKRKLSFDEKLEEDLPCKRSLLDDDVFEYLHTLFVDYDLSDDITQEVMCRGS